MKAIQQKIEIQWPVKALFNYVSDLSNNAEWQEQVTGASWISEEKNRSGAKFIETRRVSGQEFAATVEVTDFELYKKRGLSILNGPVRHLTMEFEPKGEHTVMKVTLDLRTKGIMRPLAGAMARQVIRNRYLDLVRLKRLLEHSN
jgi:hypothetical protein